MKRFIGPVALIALITFTSVTPAAAWHCVAAGTTGARGWATKYWLGNAKYSALYQCARRTPRGSACYIVGCL